MDDFLTQAQKDLVQSEFKKQSGSVEEWIEKNSAMIYGFIEDSEPDTTDDELEILIGTVFNEVRNLLERRIA